MSQNRQISAHISTVAILGYDIVPLEEVHNWTNPRIRFTECSDEEITAFKQEFTGYGGNVIEARWKFSGDVYYKCKISSCVIEEVLSRAEQKDVCENPEVKEIVQKAMREKLNNLPLKQKVLASLAIEGAGILIGHAFGEVTGIRVSLPPIDVQY
ncbi:hypothetical protein PT974_12174 [Cladobotryum mycophilum]|uniref:Uncharacterized protein n=1 Tax=Cladobotryum mycophilum TaxID=491253 RepID=A0ABR0S793_9HYPO